MKIGRGVSITVKDEAGSIIIPGENGCLGELEPQKLTIIVTIDRASIYRGEFFALERQGAIHAILKKDYVQDPMTRKYKRVIEILHGDNGPYTAYPANHFKLLELYKGGKFKVWEIAVTMRGQGQFFLTTQAVWNEQAYRDGSTVVLPAISDWVSLRKVMFMTPEERAAMEMQRKQKNKKSFVSLVPADHENLLQLRNLDPVSKYQPRPLTTANGLEKNQGRILWWNDAHGIGACITTSGPARIHRDNLVPREENFITFEKGEVVSFTQLVPPMIKKGEKTEFRFEAVGVEAVPIDANGIVLEALAAL